jgi:hypothetical protein
MHHLNKYDGKKSSGAMIPSRRFGETGHGLASVSGASSKFQDQACSFI